MKHFPIDKYEIEIRQHPEHLGVETIARSTYAGKPVFGKAICHVNDEYDEEFGIKLACARCAAKIAKRRMARADRKTAEAMAAYYKAYEELGKMRRYQTDSVDAYLYAIRKVNELESSAR